MLSNPHIFPGGMPGGMPGGVDEKGMGEVLRGVVGGASGGGTARVSEDRRMLANVWRGGGGGRDWGGEGGRGL